MPSLRSLAATVAASALLVVPASALAAPATVNLRVEGPSSTIYEGPVTTDVHKIDAPDHSTHQVAPRDCDGFHNSGNPYGYAGPVPTATGALDDGSKLAGFSWDGEWYDGLNELFVNHVGSQAMSSSMYWTSAINWRTDPNYGGCTDEVRTGDDLVWAAYEYGSPFLQLTGTPTRAATNEAFTVTVLNQDGAGTATPGAGASVGGQTTDAQGKATIAFADAGNHTLKASRSGAVRSNAQTVCVYVPGSGDCGTDKASTDSGGSGGAAQQPSQPVAQGPAVTPAAKDTTPPGVKISSLTPGKTYKRGPRVLSGDVNDAGGIYQVFLRLRATNGGDLTSASRCRWFSGKRGVFTHRTVPCAKARYFRIGKGRHFSYLLPARLDDGKYVLDVKVLDNSYNAGRSSVAFGVK